MREIKVYWKHGQQGPGHYEEDNPDADYPNEVFVPGIYTIKLECIPYAFADMKHAFDREDGDEDSFDTIMFITDSEDRIIYDRETMNSEVQKKFLIDCASEWTDS